MGPKLARCGFGCLLHVLASVFAVLIRAELCGCLTTEEARKINSACLLCDQNFTQFINNYQVYFFKGFDEKTADPLDVANFHCSRMALVGQCYVDCLQGNRVLYKTPLKTYYKEFYRKFCDSNCRLAFLPYCYLSEGMDYNLYRTGCDEANHLYKQSLVSCIDYWSGIQNCRGVCTAGQRATSTMTFALESMCRIPIAADACGETVTLCIEKTFGSYGSSFIRETESVSTSNGDSCSAYGEAFATCLRDPKTKGIVDACSQQVDAANYLIDLASAIVKPLCDSPSQNLSSYCANRTSTSAVNRTTTLTAVKTTTAAYKETSAPGAQPSPVTTMIQTSTQYSPAVTVTRSSATTVTETSVQYSPIVTATSHSSGLTVSPNAEKSVSKDGDNAGCPQQRRLAEYKILVIAAMVLFFSNMCSWPAGCREHVF